MIALWYGGREDEADALTVEALDLARTRGNLNYTGWLAGARISVLLADGGWDEAVELGAAYLPDAAVSQGNVALRAACSRRSRSSAATARRPESTWRSSRPG